ncbi:MAG: hypothetical protein RLZZ12_32 [Actinomycetota bacterium]|jgi:primosomal protein N' (replication factor Y)
MSAKPLKLKRERAKTVIRTGNYSKSAEVLIDHELSHLDKPFSYGIPEDLLEEVGVGSRVLVPFQNGEREGVIVAVGQADNVRKKPILKCISQSAYSQDALNLAHIVGRRYGAPVVKVLTYVPISKSRRTFDDNPGLENGAKGRVAFHYLARNTLRDLIRLLENNSGSMLCVLPTEREAESFLRQVAGVFPDRVVKGFGRARFPETFPPAAIVVGTRSTIFWQIPNLADIVVLHEGSEHYWSEKFPYWNVRDIALLRAQVMNLNLTFISGFPTPEISRLVELGFIEIKRNHMSNPLKRSRISSAPETYHRTIREGLRNGVVLVNVASKEYSSLFICKKCRNRPICNCGFPLKMKRDGDFYCSACSNSFSEWRCSHCFSTERFLLNRGAVRIEEELGKAFPAVPIFLSTSAKPLVDFPERGIVVATPGMEPANGYFAGLVLLDGELQLNFPSLRAEEKLLNQWFSLVARGTEAAPVYLSLPAQHRIVQAFNARGVRKLSNSILEERRDAKLPPWYRFIRLTGPNLVSLQQKLVEEFPTIEVSKMVDSSEILIRVPVERSQEVVDAISTLAKYRSAKGMELISLRVDPYEI